MERIEQLHARLQVTITATLLLLALWGLALFLLRRGVGQLYPAGLTIAALLVAAQALLGLPLLATAADPAALILHVIYGAVAVACLPAAFRYTRGRAGPWEALTYAGVCLFLVGIAIRAYETGI